MAEQTISYETVLDGLLATVPELRSLYDEHLHDNDEPLPHVFLGDVTRYVMQLVRAIDSTHDVGLPGPLVRVLSFLEKAMISSDARVQELVSVSFLENLDSADDGYMSLMVLLGPNLRRQLEAYD
jgi:hypothetical protein